MEKQFIEEQALLLNSYRLGVQVYNSGFRPQFIVGLWRGGSSVGIAVQECLQHLGVETDHISVRTSYRGMESYQRTMNDPQRDIRVHGTQYLLENLNADTRLLIVDDVYSSGLSIQAVLDKLKKRAKRNMPDNVRIAAPFYKPTRNSTKRVPDFYLHETDRWLVLPYEITGLTRDEIETHKPYLVPVLDEINTSTDTNSATPTG